MTGIDDLISKACFFGVFLSLAIWSRLMYQQESHSRRLSSVMVML